LKCKQSVSTYGYHFAPTLCNSAATIGLEFAFSISNHLLRAVPCLRRLVACLSLWRPGFAPGSVHVSCFIYGRYRPTNNSIHPIHASQLGSPYWFVKDTHYEIILTQFSPFSYLFLFVRTTAVIWFFFTKIVDLCSPLGSSPHPSKQHVRLFLYFQLILCLGRPGNWEDSKRNGSRLSLNLYDFYFLVSALFKCYTITI
jgi:hypothetical protein